MNKHAELVRTVVARWTDVRTAIGGSRRPTPLTVLNAVRGLAGVAPSVVTAADDIRPATAEAFRHWRGNNRAFTNGWNQVGPALDTATTAAEMTTALEAAVAAGAPVNLGPARALVAAGAASIYDAGFVAGQPAPGGTTDVARLLRTGVKGAVKGTIGANGVPVEAVAVAASLSDLLDQHWS